MLLGESEAEAKVAVTNAVIVAATERRATAPGNVVPATSTKHAARKARPTIRTGRIRLMSIIIFAIPVRTPF